MHSIDKTSEVELGEHLSINSIIMIHANTNNRMSDERLDLTNLCILQSHASY
jgi:hypothetical protein